MASRLDMALDDLVAMNRGRGRGRGNRGGGRGASRGFRSAVGNSKRGGGSYASRGSGGTGRGGRGRGRQDFAGGVQRRSRFVTGARAAPYEKRTTEVPEGRWTHDKFEGDPEGKWTHDKFDPGAEDVGRSATIIISNLDYEVTNEELKELLTTIGPVSLVDIDYDRAGRSTGSARATFVRRSDALEAIKKFNGAEVDGKVLSIELAASNARKSRREAETETPVAKQASRFVQAATSARRGGRGRVSVTATSRGRVGFGFGRSRGRVRRSFFNR